MSRCIYCLDTLVPKVDGDSPKNPSLEHVVPWALGGSNGCATEEVCRDCNSTLGDSVDAACINQPIVMMIRHQFGTAGQSGVVPDLVVPTRSVETNEPGRMTFPYKDVVTVKHEPVVIREPMTDAEKVFVAGSPKDVGRILRGMADKAKARGQRLTNPDGSELDIKAAVAAAEAEISTTYHVPTSVDLTGMRRELAKIAFGFLHLTLGWAWTGSGASEPLRRVARGLSTADEVDAAMMGLSDGFRGLLPLSHAQPTDHVVALMPGDDPWIVVSLFGDQLLTAAVKSGAPRDVVEEGLGEIGRMMVTIDPRSRVASWFSRLDVALHVMRSLPTGPR